MSEQVTAVVVAAGLGTRYGGDEPKQMLKITDKALVRMSIEAMAAGGCTHVIVVLNEQIAHKLGHELTALPVPVYQTFGGDTRQQSVHNGLRLIREEPELADTSITLIHDAVRPMAPADVVHRVIQAVRDGAEAVAPALPVPDSMRMTQPDGSSEPLDRKALRIIQTPQGFPSGVIWEAHEQMAAKGLEFTDDVSCAQLAGHPVTLVEGSNLAMKITEPADMTIARALWKMRKSIGHHSGKRITRHLNH